MTETRKESSTYDLVEIAKFCMGDEEMLQELVEDFCTHTRADLKRLEAAFRSGDYAQLREIAHQLASRLSQFNIKAGTKARHLEDKLKANKSENIEYLVNEIVSDCSSVLDQMALDNKVSITSNPK